MSGMRRREFVILLGGSAAAAWPLAAHAQQAGKVHRIGFLGSATAAGSAKAIKSTERGSANSATLRARILIIEFRWAEGTTVGSLHVVAELIATNVDVLITHGTPGTRVAKQATTTIPIVMAISGDAIATGLVSSLARPEANLTGSTFFFDNSMRSDWNCSRRRVRTFPRWPRCQILTILSADRSFLRCRKPPRP